MEDGLSGCRGTKRGLELQRVGRLVSPQAVFSGRREHSTCNWGVADAGVSHAESTE